MDNMHHRFSISVNAAPIMGEMSVIFSGDGEPVARHYIGPAVHDYFLIHVVLSGEGTFETLGETHRLGAGDAFVIFPDILVKYEASENEPWTYMWIGFTGENAEPALDQIGLSPDRAVIRGVSVARMKRWFKRVRHSLDHYKTPELGNMEASGWLRLAMHELGRTMLQEGSVTSQPPVSKEASQSRSFRQIEQAIGLLSFQFGQHTSIQSIANALGYHRTHLTKLFKEATGLSPMQYLHKVRMRKAEALLESNDLTIAQVATSVGYNDPLFFSKQFRKWRGHSPSDYRRELVEKKKHL